MSDSFERDLVEQSARIVSNKSGLLTLSKENSKEIADAFKKCGVRSVAQMCTVLAITDSLRQTEVPIGYWPTLLAISDRLYNEELGGSAQPSVTATGTLGAAEVDDLTAAHDSATKSVGNKHKKYRETVSILRNSMASIIDAIGAGLVQRKVETRLIVLAAITQQHLVLLGPPGVAKSMLLKRIGLWVRDEQRECDVFERLLTPYSQPDELFGPIGMEHLRHDRVVRVTQGFLPSAHVAFLDEIFNANSAILNSLLTLLNERQFDNGAFRVRTSLRLVVGASNRYPRNASELFALYDRFLFRRWVPNVEGDGTMNKQTNAFLHLMLGDSVELSDEQRKLLEKHALTPTAVEAIQFCADQHVAPLTIASAVMKLLVKLERVLALGNRGTLNSPIYVSARRWLAVRKVLKVVALMRGDTNALEEETKVQIELLDVLVAQHILWRKHTEQPLIRAEILALLLTDEFRQQFVEEAHRMVKHNWLSEEDRRAIQSAVDGLSKK